MKTYKVYYNDQVNEPTLINEESTIEKAIEKANSHVGSEIVRKEDNTDVQSRANTARIEVYEDDMIVFNNDEAELQDPVYTTDFFYVE